MNCAEKLLEPTIGEPDAFCQYFQHFVLSVSNYTYADVIEALNSAFRYQDDLKVL